MAYEDDEEKPLDDKSIGLQMQQFLDEWHYRVLHSNLAMTWDRIECVTKALDLFDLFGLTMAAEEKIELAQLDEEVMIDQLVKRMPMSLRKTFEHFALQLQLVVSTVTRVRHALEDADPQEIARVMEDGDTGINQQVLKRAVIEASKEVAEVKEVHISWEKNMDIRIHRLQGCSEDAEHAQQQLAALQGQLDSFGGSQNAKAKNVLMGMIGNQDKAVMHAAFSAWEGWYIKFKSEEEIHKKFRDEIAHSERLLFEYKQAQLSNIRGVLGRKGAAGENEFKKEILNVWVKWVACEKEDRELGGAMKAAEDKLHSYKQSQQDNTKKVMMRMTAGNDQTLMELCYQSWNKWIEEARKNKGFEDAVRESEKQVAEFMKKKSDEAKGVLSRMSGSTDSGLLSQVMNAWSSEVKDNKKAREFEDQMNSANSKFASLNSRQKGAASGTASRTNDMIEENLITQIFINWAAEAKLDRVVRHYGGKMDAKRHQLEAVQSMFKSFATQLENGIGNTPRSQRKSNRGSSNPPGGSEKPPQMPAGPA